MRHFPEPVDNRPIGPPYAFLIEERTKKTNGSYIGMDRFGIDVLLPFEDRVNTVAELCKQGYAAKIVLSHDASCFIDWFDAEMRAAAMPKWNFTHISDEVLPALRARGVTEAQINQMLVENPRRIFEHGGAY